MVATKHQKAQVAPAVVSFEIPGHAKRVYPLPSQSHTCKHVWGTLAYVDHPPAWVGYALRAFLARPPP